MTGQRLRDPRQPPRVAASRLAALLVLTALLTAGGAALATGAAAVPPRFFGIAPQDRLTEDDAARMSRGGIESVRLPIAWSAIQPRRTSDYEWDAVDAQVEFAARNGMEVLPVLYHAPRWATGDSTRLPVGTASQRTAWKKFLTAAVERYGPEGEFWEPDPVEEARTACSVCPEQASGLVSRVAADTPPTPIRIWQIWNEENFFYFTKPASPTRYARLLKVSRPAIRTVDPAAKVILGGLFGNPKERPPRAMPATRFLAKLYAVPQIKAYFDGVALHPYSADTAGVRKLSEAIRQIMRRNGDARTGFYITEVGWGSEANSSIAFEKGPRGQARELRRAYGYLVANQRRLNLKAVYWFSWKDAPTSPCVYCDSVGLFRAGSGYTAKPAWFSFVRFTGGRPDPPPPIPEERG